MTKPLQANTAPASPQALTKPETASLRSLRDVMTDLDRADPSSPFCNLLSPGECKAAITRIEEALSSVTQPEEALRLGERMIGVYRRDEVNDPALYASAVAGTLADYPVMVADRVTHPLHGLPSKLKFLPSIAEVRAACEAEHAKQKARLYRAKWMLDERRKREQEAAPKPQVDPQRVDEILRRFRA